MILLGERRRSIIIPHNSRLTDVIPMISPKGLGKLCEGGGCDWIHNVQSYGLKDSRVVQIQTLHDHN